MSGRGLHLVQRAGSVRRGARPAETASAALALSIADQFAGAAEPGRLARALDLDEASVARLQRSPRLRSRLSQLVAARTSLGTDAAASVLCAKAIVVRSAEDADWRLALSPRSHLDRLARLVGVGWQAPQLRRIVGTAALRHIAESVGDDALDFARRFGPTRGPAEGESSEEGSELRAERVLAQAPELGWSGLDWWLDEIAPALAMRLRLAWPLPEPRRIGQDGAAAAARLVREAAGWLDLRCGVGQ